MDLSSLIGSAAAVAGGGIFGLIGSVCGNTAKYLQKRQDQKFELSKFDHEKALLKLNIEAKAKLSEAEFEQERTLLDQAGTWKGLESSIAADAGLKPVSKWAQDAKALFRPFLTVLLWVFASWIFYKIVWSTQSKIFTAAETKDLIKYMVSTVFFSASTATVWWFGDRSLTPPGQKK